MQQAPSKGKQQAAPRKAAPCGRKQEQEQKEGATLHTPASSPPGKQRKGPAANLAAAKGRGRRVGCRFHFKFNSEGTTLLLFRLFAHASWPWSVPGRGVQAAQHSAHPEVSSQDTSGMRGGAF